MRLLCLRLFKSFEFDDRFQSFHSNPLNSTMDEIIILRLLYLSLSDDIVIWTASFRRTVSFRNEHCVGYFYSSFQNSPWKSIRKTISQWYHHHEYPAQLHEHDFPAG